MTTQEAKDFALKLIAYHLPKGWQFAWVPVEKEMEGWLGYCSQPNKIIYLSPFLVEHEPDEIVEDIILHEIAHAMTPGHGHGFLWRVACNQLGARPNAKKYKHDIPNYYKAKQKFFDAGVEWVRSLQTA